MSWIKLHSNLSRHRKLKKLARTLNISTAQAMGHVIAFWSNVLDLAEDGVITKWSKEDIAEYSEWRGDPTDFYNALKNGGDGFIDEREDKVIVHDWFKYAGNYLKTKYRTNNPERLKSITSIYTTEVILS